MTPCNILDYQPKAWSILSRSFERDRTASTYLLHGPDGVGQWPLVLAFTALLNCADPRRDETSSLLLPCCECRNCRAVFELNFEGQQFAVPIPSAKSAGNQIDLINEVLDRKREEAFSLQQSAKSVSIPIALAREIKKNLSRKSTGEMVRVVMFYRMEKMLQSSADALLKLIEEPPPDTVIILTAEKPDQLLPTIQSRSQRIRLERVQDDVAQRYLREHYDVSEQKAQMAARVTRGNLGQAVAMLDDSAEGDEQSQRAVGFLLFKSLFLDDNPTTVHRLVDLVNERDRSGAEELLKFWQLLVRDCAYYAVSGDEDGLVNVDFATDLKKLSTRFQDSAVADRMATVIKNALADLPRNVHIQPALVATVLRLKSPLTSAA